MKLLLIGLLFFVKSAFAFEPVIYSGFITSTAPNYAAITDCNMVFKPYGTTQGFYTNQANWYFGSSPVQVTGSGKRCMMNLANVKNSAGQALPVLNTARTFTVQAAFSALPMMTLTDALNLTYNPDRQVFHHTAGINVINKNAMSNRAVMSVRSNGCGVGSVILSDGKCSNSWNSSTGNF